MIQWSRGGHVHSFMRDRSSIWRRITVAARTGLARLSLLIIAVGLTPRPTRGSPYPRASRVSCLVGSSRKWTGAIRQQDVCGKRKGEKDPRGPRGRPVSLQFVSLSPYAQKIRQKPFRGGAREREGERGRGGKEGDKDLPAAFWTLPPPQILSQPSLKEERDLRTRFVDRGFASTKIGFLSLSRISLTRIIFIHIVNWK